MAAKIAFVVCASAILVELITAECIGSPYNPAIVGPGMIADGAFAANYANDLTYNNIGARGAYGPANGLVAPTSGGGFAVTSSSPIAPMGLRVTSENVIEGVLAVTGELPVLSAVALEGALPTAGSGAIAYGCGDGTIGIVSELSPKLPYGAPLAAEMPFSGPLAGTYRGGLGPLAPAARGCGAL